MPTPSSNRWNKVGQTELTYLRCLPRPYKNSTSTLKRDDCVRHLWLLRLTNDSIPGPKPAIFLLAGQRPRDIAGSEMLRRYISLLTQSYGVDPDITFLLDRRTIYILPV